MKTLADNLATYSACLARALDAAKVADREYDATEYSYENADLLDEILRRRGEALEEAEASRYAVAAIVRRLRR